MRESGRDSRSTITLNELRRVLIERVLRSDLSSENKVKVGIMIIDALQEERPMVKCKKG